MFARGIKIVILALLCLNLPSAFAGIVVGGTRVIFHGNDPDSTISIYNKEVDLPYLIQVWVDPFSKDDK
ncbi:fimbria/pilus periplasmic chaperone, partial [Escherichia coli]